MRKISLSNFTHLNKIKWRIFIPVQKAWYVKKIARGGWSGFGKALTWDPSQMITCHPKKIPKFLLKGGVVQFCQILHNCKRSEWLTVIIDQGWTEESTWNWQRFQIARLTGVETRPGCGTHLEFYAMCNTYYMHASIWNVWNYELWWVHWVLVRAGVDPWVVVQARRLQTLLIIMVVVALMLPMAMFTMMVLILPINAQARLPAAHLVLLRFFRGSQSFQCARWAQRSCHLHWVVT